MMDLASGVQYQVQRQPRLAIGAVLRLSGSPLLGIWFPASAGTGLSGGGASRKIKRWVSPPR